MRKYIVRGGKIYGGNVVKHHNVYQLKLTSGVIIAASGDEMFDSLTEAQMCLYVLKTEANHAL